VTGFNSFWKICPHTVISFSFKYSKKYKCVYIRYMFAKLEYIYLCDCQWDTLADSIWNCLSDSLTDSLWDCLSDMFHSTTWLILFNCFNNFFRTELDRNAMLDFASRKKAIVLENLVSYRLENIVAKVMMFFILNNWYLLTLHKVVEKVCVTKVMMLQKVVRLRNVPPKWE